MMRALIGPLTALSLLLAPASAQTAAEPSSAARSALDAWRLEHGEEWQVHRRSEDGAFELLFGGRMAPDFAPRQDSDFFELARRAVVESEALHGVVERQLVEERMRYLPLSQVGTTDKMAVKFRQRVNGVPVVFGYVNALFDTDGHLLAMQSTAIPAMPEIDTTPGLSEEQARRFALAHFDREMGVPGSVVGEPSLWIDRRPDTELVEPVLVWEIDVQWHQDHTHPEGFTYRLDAATGAVVNKQTNVHFFDVTGSVSTLASPGTLPDIASNPEAPFPVAYARIETSVGTIVADENGDFVIPGVNSVDDVTVRYRGTYTNVLNSSQAPYVLNVGTLSGTGNVINMNTTPDQFVTAEANAYVSIYELRDWIVSVNPSDTTPNFSAAARTNINNNCNAFFDGGSVNFYTSGGGCSNTSYSTVVSHEMGHWLNVLYDTGNGADGMGEGNADVFAMYLDDTAIVGENFSGGGFIRSGNNTRQYCGDCCGGCYGGVHANGEVWMGAAWKVRANLKSSLGNGLGSATADNLFSAWMNTYNQASIKSVIEIQWLTLDDDDGNILNGTPNYPDINAGFLAQGFPGYTLPAIAIYDVTDIGETEDELGPYAVSARIEPVANSSLTSTTLFYNVNGTGWNSVPMANQGGNDFLADIPGQPIISIVQYYIEAVDNASVVQTFPEGGATAPLLFYVGELDVLLVDRFNVDKGWQVESFASTGAWERVPPIGTSSGGVQVAPSSDYGSGTRCYVTQQSSNPNSTGEFDIDGGPVILTSPALNYDGHDGVIRYAYWLYNDDNDDSLIVEVSNNGGGSWTEVTRYTGGLGGWNEDAFILSDHIAPTADVRVRFVCSDNPNNSITEAAVDEFFALTTEDLGPACPEPIMFCDANVNSLGEPAELIIVGSTSVSANDMLLVATPIKPGNNGVFVYSPDAVAPIPLGDGNLCLGNQTLGFVLRLPFATADVTNTMIHILDNTNPPVEAGLITPGSTWYFQCWYRDPDAGGAGFNFSTAAEIEFCP